MPPPTDPEQEIADALAGFLDREANEEPVDIDAYCLAHPRIEAELRSQIAAARELDRLLEPSGEPLPETLSGHRILDVIGAGGMGRVYLAHDERLGRHVAIKTLAPRLAGRPALRERFLHEARAMARLSHPNIVRIYNLGPAGEPPHFVMEHIEGSALTTVAQPLPLRQKIELLLKVVRAVEVLHRHQIVHRDLKPGNILVGPDLEPKVLDFGLALETDENRRLTPPGAALGTPEYMAPEQSQPSAIIDARTDVFALGVILYEILTGRLPSESPGESIPVLPRRIRPSIPGDLQNVCMKALEQDPAARYAAAAEMAADLEHFLAGEAVHAAPAAYGRLMREAVGRHLRQIEGWRDDRILSDGEFDALRKCYDRLEDREDAWIMEARRLTLPQVSLYVGAWLSILGAFLLVLFHYAGLSGTPEVLLSAAAAVPMAAIGLRSWDAQRYRVGVAFLLAFSLMLPAVFLVAMSEYGLATALSQGREDLEFLFQFESFHRVTNAQLWWALLLSLPAHFWLRRRTRSSVFALVLSVVSALLVWVTLLRMGLLDWIEHDPGRLYLDLLPFALAFFAAAILLERRRCQNDSRYFYPIAVAFTFIALSGVAQSHEPYRHWLETTFPWTRGSIEYLYIINAGAYFSLHLISVQFSSAQMRTVAKAFRFVVPGHVLMPLLLLGIAASARWHDSPVDLSLRFEARLFEVLLPLVALAVLYLSIPRQMKNYLASGALFLAIGVVRLEQDLLRDNALWPVSLLTAGLLLMLAAANYSSLKLAVARLRRRA